MTNSDNHILTSGKYEGSLVQDLPEDERPFYWRRYRASSQDIDAIREYSRAQSARRWQSTRYAQ